MHACYGVRQGNWVELESGTFIMPVRDFPPLVSLQYSIPQRHRAPTRLRQGSLTGDLNIVLAFVCFVYFLL
jgi:hypothetical protein